MVERGKSIPLPHKYITAHFPDYGTGTSVKSGGVRLA